ncbi:MAG TPA: DNA polymerase III subunit delta [Gammaproteobacteria bacterium]|nr:DNA polymerase III subunit delta [Gammaproteobacteria bacterium]
MKLTPERLAGQLKGALAPVYLIAGDEPLQREESADQIRAAARAQGYTDREVFVAERGFDWQSLLLAGASLSLFATKRILELRLPTGKPGNKGAEALLAYAADPAADTLLLIISDERLEGGASWVSALEKAGVYLQVWPVEPREIPAWVSQRLKSRGLQPTPDAVALIAGRVEGNLLAAAQEVDKLVLLHSTGPLDADAVAEAVSDSARFDAFKLVDAALAGDVPRSVRVLEGLQAEGEEPVLVLGALLRQLKELASLSIEIESGQAPQRVLAGIWERRRPLVQTALKRRKARGWQRLLRRAQSADLVMKGRAPGRAWDELLQLTTAMAGMKSSAV